VCTIICDQEMCYIRRVHVTKLGAVVKRIYYYIKNSAEINHYLLLYLNCVTGNLWFSLFNQFQVLVHSLL